MGLLADASGIKSPAVLLYYTTQPTQFQIFPIVKGNTVNHVAFMFGLLWSFTYYELEIARYISHLSNCFCACAQKQRIPIVI